MTGLQISMLAFVFAIMLVAFFLGVVITSKVTEEHRLVSRRIDAVIEKKKLEEKRKRERRKKKQKGKEQQGFVAQQSVLQKIGDAIFEELMAADILMKPEEFAIVWIVLAAVPAFLAILLSSNRFLPFVLSIVGIALPMIYVKNKQAKRVKAFENQLSDALLISCNCLRSGLTFAQAMENIAEEMDAPIGTEFKRAVNEMNYGSSLEEVLNGMCERINSSDLLLTVAAVNVQRQTGGNLSKILEVISETIRDRIKIKGEIKTLTSQGRTSGLIIGGLPVAIGMILMVISPDYITTFIDTEEGNIMLIICAALEAIGFFFINKTVTIKY